MSTDNQIKLPTYVQTPPINRDSMAGDGPFKATLERRGVAVSLRASRGLDQDAACGQLVNKLK